jgi:4-amino-4-deoxy-L-arabinose transferase-like glycosyltransferase
MDLHDVALIFAAALCVFAMLTRRGKDSELQGGDTACSLLALGLFALAAFVRVYRFGEIPGGMSQEGSLAGTQAKALLDYGTDPLGRSFPMQFVVSGDRRMDVLLSYLMAPCFKIFGYSALSACLPMLLCSLMGIGVCYFFAKKAFGKRAALVVLAVLALSPWSIQQARWAQGSNLLPHFLMLGMLLLALGLEKRPLLYLSMAAFALAMYACGVGFLPVPLLLLVFYVYLLSKKQIRLLDALGSGAVYLLLCGPLIACLVSSLLGLEDLSLGLITIPSLPAAAWTEEILFFSGDIPAQLTKNLQALGLFLSGGEELGTLPGFGAVYLFGLAFAGLGVWDALLRAKDSAHPRRAALSMLLLLWLGVSLLNALAINDAASAGSMLVYPLTMLCGLGVYRATALLSGNRRGAAILCGGMYLVSFLLFCNAYFGVPGI